MRPRGALAAWTYGFGQLYGFAGAQEMYEQFHSGTLGPFWASGRELVDREYAGIEPGPQHFGEVRRLQLPMPSHLTLDQLVGQLRSWSAYLAYLRAHPAAPDPVDTFRRQSAQRMAAEGGRDLELRRSITLLVALRPRPLRGVTMG
ncbi:putative methyltransferase [Tetrabaena socialis]|uniref:Putative methyltransferase n=1 Tax=Tetrabaena socialis TaxID=47790 RepID=A0A2J7ZNF6_9CHLO|nr:putative methyltransferase [Tetrabaena socialis]|eukprot:PNH01796.1 putative methyltransferase [Tetrabaena socialis]